MTIAPMEERLRKEWLLDADTADAMKAFWRSALIDLKGHLESAG